MPVLDGVWCSWWSTHTKHSLSHLWLHQERGESVIILFVRHQMIFLWPLDIWNIDNRQFSSCGRSPIASFISDKLPEQNCSFRAVNDTSTMWRERVGSFEWRRNPQCCPNKPNKMPAEGLRSVNVSGGMWLRLLLMPKECICVCVLSVCCEAVPEFLLCF